MGHPNTQYYLTLQNINRLSLYIKQNNKNQFNNN